MVEGALRLEALSVGLAVAICADRASLLHDCSHVICAIGLSLNENKFAMMQCDGVTLDYVIRKLVIGKVRFKRPNDGAAVRFGWHHRLRIAPESGRRMTQSKRDRVPFWGVFCHDGLVVNCFVKASACQFVDGLVQVSRVIEYPDDGGH
jgi:hypothetical protein